MIKTLSYIYLDVKYLYIKFSTFQEAWSFLEGPSLLEGPFYLYLKIFDTGLYSPIMEPMTPDQVDVILQQWSRERPDLDPAPMGVIGRISRASRYIDQYLHKNFANFGLNNGDFDVLATLRRNGAPYQLTPTALFSSLMLSSGAMTNRLDRLEKAGFIERRPDPSDRRGVLVTLTGRGLAVIDEAVAAHVAHERQMLAALTPDEQQALADLLRRLLVSFRDDSAAVSS